MENALQQVKRRSRSIEHERGSLLELRADLRNLRGVAASIGHEFALKNPQLLGQLYSVFSEKLRSRFVAQYPASNWTFEQYLEFLSSEISHVDSLHHMQVDCKEHIRGDKKGRRTSPAWSRSQVLLRVAVASRQSVATASEGDKVRQCPVHPGATSHDLGQCRGFAQMPIDERWTIAKESGMCFNCLGGKHSSPQCKLKSPCNRCDAFHHALLHRDGNRKHLDLPHSLA